MVIQVQEAAAMNTTINSLPVKSAKNQKVYNS